MAAQSTSTDHFGQHHRVFAATTRLNGDAALAEERKKTSHAVTWPAR
jgi:hypothetical protein